MKLKISKSVYICGANGYVHTAVCPSAKIKISGTL